MLMLKVEDVHQQIITLKEENNMLKSKKLYPALIVVYSILPIVAAAQSVNLIITNILATMNLVIGALFVMATLVFLWGMVLFIAKSGDEAARSKAKGIMTWGIIGLAVMAAAWGISNILVQYFGVPFTGPTFRSIPAAP